MPNSRVETRRLARLSKPFTEEQLSDVLAAVAAPFSGVRSFSLGRRFAIPVNESVRESILSRALA
jgi:hypothetical protein